MSRREWAPLVGFSVLVVLWAHYFREFIGWEAALVGLGAFHGLALIHIKLRVNPLFASIQVLVLPWLVRALLLGGLWVLAPEQAAPSDILLPLYDRYLLLMYPAVALHWALTGISARYPRFTPWRSLVHLALLALVFGLPDFELTEGSLALPFTLAISGGLLLWELEQLRRDNLRLGWGLPPIWFLGLLPLILSGASLAYIAYSENKAGEQAGLLQPTLFGYDFTPLVRLENQISMSDNLIFVLKKDGPPESYLLRRQVLNAYDATRGFYAEPRWLTATETALNFTSGGLILPEVSSRLRESLVYDILAVNLEPASILAVNEPKSVERLMGYDPRRFRGAYRVLSRALPPKLARVARNPAEAGVSQEYWDFHTAVPPDPKLRDLALQLTRDIIDPTKKVERLERFFHEEFYYSLKPATPPNTDPLRHFLFESRRGYCSYFAFSMVLLLRHLNIPSRLAVGFFTDPQRQVLGYYPVRGFQAHAWVEVLSAGEGWMSYDPTTDRLAPGEDISFGAEQGDEFFDLIESLLAQELQPVGEPKEVLSQQPPAATEPWLLWGALLLAVLALTLYKLRFRIPILLCRDPRRKIVLSYRLFRRQIEAGLDGDYRDLSAMELAQRVGDTTFSQITDIYLEARFSDHPRDRFNGIDLAALERRLPKVNLFPRFWRWFWY